MGHPPHWFYLYSPYFLPLVGFVGGIFIVLLCLLLQFVFLAQCLGEDLVKLHVKYARILLGKYICLPKQDNGYIIIHENAFIKAKAFAYICMTECILIGTIFLYTLANTVRVSTEPCNSLTEHADCFLKSQSSPDHQNCSAHLEKGTASDLVCYNMVYDFGIGLAVFGGLLYLLPLLQSFITGFFAKALDVNKDQLPLCIIALLQVALVMLLLVCVTGILSLAHKDPTHVPKTAIEVTIFLLFLSTALSMPWCCMGRDKTKAYTTDHNGSLTESYDRVDLPDEGGDERQPIINRRQYYANRRSRYPRDQRSRYGNY